MGTHFTFRGIDWSDLDTFELDLEPTTRQPAAPRLTAYLTGLTVNDMECHELLSPVPRRAGVTADTVSVKSVAFGLLEDLADPTALTEDDLCEDADRSLRGMHRDRRDQVRAFHDLIDLHFGRDQQHPLAHYLELADRAGIGYPVVHTNEQGRERVDKRMPAFDLATWIDAARGVPVA